MANVTINNDTKYVELKTLCEGEYFLLDDELYLVVDDSFSGYSICFNLSHDESREEFDNETKVFRIPSNKVKIKVDF